MIKQIVAGNLSVGYLEYGPADGPVAILMHGFPYDAYACAESAEILAEQGMRTIVPFLRGFGPTRFCSAAIPRSGEQAALGADLLALMDALSVKRAVLAGFDWGGRAASIVAALWPERVAGLVSCGVGYNIQNIAAAINPAAPEEEARYWYIYYFHTERGRLALEQNRQDLCRYIWQLWSPGWDFGDQTYIRTASSFENPDFVEIVIHSYRHRFGGLEGDPKYAPIENQLSLQPTISVPTIVMQGCDDRVDPPGEVDLARPFFTGAYERKLLSGIGHNPPQEAPVEFAKAVASLISQD